MTRRKLALFGLAMIGGAMGVSRSSEAAGALAAWRWKSRLLLIFAPDEASAPLQAQRATLAASRAAASERDLSAIEIVGGHADHALDPTRLRHEHGVADQAFVVILIGKDGGEKLRRSHPIAADELFGVIDCMPMRRDEAARR